MELEIRHQLTEVYGELRMDIKKSESGVGVHLVALNFTTKNEAGDCQLATRRSRRLRKPCVKISVDDLCISIPEVSRTTIYQFFMDKLQYQKVCARWVP